MRDVKKNGPDHQNARNAARVPVFDAGHICGKYKKPWGYE